MDDALKLVFEDAIEMARSAKTELAKAPVVNSKRGGGRTSPWLIVWDRSVQNAVRLARLLQQGGGESPSLERELDDLLGEGSP
jgi:hypothetical protein